MECLIRLANGLNNYVTFRPSGPGAERPHMPCFAKLLIQVKKRWRFFQDFFPLVARHALQPHFLLEEHLGHIGRGRCRASEWRNCLSIFFVECELDTAATAIRGQESSEWQQSIIALVLCV